MLLPPVAAAEGDGERTGSGVQQALGVNLDLATDDWSV